MADADKNLVWFSGCGPDPSPISSFASLSQVALQENSDDAGRFAIRQFPGKGRGLVALTPFEVGAPVIDFDVLAAIDTEFLWMAFFTALGGMAPQDVLTMLDGVVQVRAHDYIVVRAPAIFANHSCTPNTVPVPGREWCDLRLEAIQPIHPGDEVMFDYALITADYYVLECVGCGPACRGFASRPLFMDQALRARLQADYGRYQLLPHVAADLAAPFSGEGIDFRLLPFGFRGADYLDFLRRQPGLDPRFCELALNATTGSSCRVRVTTQLERPESAACAPVAR